jgi:hypothetical protein
MFAQSSLRVSHNARRFATDGGRGWVTGLPIAGKMNSKVFGRGGLCGLSKRNELIAGHDETLLTSTRSGLVGHSRHMYPMDPLEGGEPVKNQNLDSPE